MVMGKHQEDHGCELASEHLGHESRCTECPFGKCVIDKKGVGILTARRALRDVDMRKMSDMGYFMREIAASFGVHERTVQRALTRSRSHDKEKVLEAAKGV